MTTVSATDAVDLEQVLSISNTDVHEAIHHVRDNADAIFTWNYDKGERPALNKLYEKAKGSQWNGETDLPWDTAVDQEAVTVQAHTFGPPFGRYIVWVKCGS